MDEILKIYTDKGLALETALADEITLIEINGKTIYKNN